MASSTAEHGGRTITADNPRGRRCASAISCLVGRKLDHATTCSGVSSPPAAFNLVSAIENSREKTRWTTTPGAIRLGGIGNIYASPVAGGGHVYITDLDGKTIVVSHDDQPKVLALNILDDEFAASTGIVGRELFLRGKSHLYCIAEPAEL